MIEKCLYYNDHASACSLMLDDLVPIAVTRDGTAGASNDWGYLANRKRSLYQYIEEKLLSRFPEIKGTFFIPAKSHHYIEESPDYIVLKKEFDKEFQLFVREFSNHFDLAFHGIKHLYYENEGNTRVKRYEFDHLLPNDLKYIREEMEKLENFFQIKFSGGKYPGYASNEVGKQMIIDLGFNWWCESAAMVNRKHPLNKPVYSCPGGEILMLPSNITGDIFSIKNYHWKELSFWKNLIKTRIYPSLFKSPEANISYLVKNQYPVIIQEHYQNQRTDGKRQTPSIYDDISSLTKIYSYLRGMDIWHTTMNNLSHYIDSYFKTEITTEQSGEIRITYNGIWEKMYLSFSSQNQEISDLSSGKIYTGIAKNGKWIFNSLKPGTYKLR